VTQYKNGNEWYEAIPDEHIKRILDGIVIYDGYYSAILGYTFVPDPHGDGKQPKDHPALVYSRTLAIKELAAEYLVDLQERDKDTPVFNAPDDDPGQLVNQAHEDAEEFFGFNVEGGWIGPSTPIIVSDGAFQELDKVRLWWPGFLGLGARCSDYGHAMFEAKAGDTRKTLYWMDSENGLMEANVLRVYPIPGCSMTAGVDAL